MNAPVTLRDLLEEFLLHGRTRNFRPRTIDSYRAECTRFLDWLESRHRVVMPDQLRRSNLDAWLRHVNGLEKLPKNGLRKIPTFVALENSPGVRP